MFPILLFKTIGGRFVSPFEICLSVIIVISLVFLKLLILAYVTKIFFILPHLTQNLQKQIYAKIKLFTVSNSTETLRMKCPQERVTHRYLCHMSKVLATT